jgi:hypothetical protein
VRVFAITWREREREIKVVKRNNVFQLCRVGFFSFFIYFEVNNDNTHGNEREKIQSNQRNQIQLRSSQGENCKFFFRGFLKQHIVTRDSIFSLLRNQIPSKFVVYFHPPPRAPQPLNTTAII